MRTNSLIHATTLQGSIFLLAVLLAALLSHSVFAYPAVHIITEGNTYRSGTVHAPALNTITITQYSNPNPYVSGPEFAYRPAYPRTYDYVDGYRDGYVQADRDGAFWYATSTRQRTSLRGIYAPQHTGRYATTPGLSCDARTGLCLYQYTRCADNTLCRTGDQTWRSWYDERYIHSSPGTPIHYGFPVTSAYTTAYWSSVW